MGPTPGMFFLTQIGGWTGRWVSAAQAFVRGGSRWTHAGIVLDGGQVIQGEPGGATIVPLATLMDGRPLLFSDAPIQRHLAMIRAGVESSSLVWDDHVERVVQDAVVSAARSLEGTPYSFLDYAALVAVEWRIPGHGALRQYVQDSGHLICSALVDRAYEMAGIHLFDDGRYPGDVTPGDLDLYANGPTWRGVAE